MWLSCLGPSYGFLLHLKYYPKSFSWLWHSSGTHLSLPLVSHPSFLPHCDAASLISLLVLYSRPCICPVSAWCFLIFPHFQVSAWMPSPQRDLPNCPYLKRPLKRVKVLVAQLCLTLCDTMDCSPPGSSVHGILQARILEWVAIPFSRGSSWLKDWTWISHIAGRFFII